MKAQFNPSIKTYILLVGGLILFITIAGIPLLVVWLLGLGQYFSKRYYEHLKCELTERHLSFSKGVLFKVEKTIPLENIQDLTFLRNPLLNILGLNILKIETAGNSNPHGTDMKLIGIVGPEAFKTKVLEQRTKLIEEHTSSPKDSNIELLTEIRDLLKDIKNK